MIRFMFRFVFALVASSLVAFATETVAQARESLRGGRVDEAYGILNRLVAEHPRHAEALHLLGMFHYRSGYYRKALELFDRSLAVHADNPEARIYRAVSQAKCGQTVEAERSFRSLMKQSPDIGDIDLLLTFCEVLYDTQRFQEATAIAGIAIAKHPQHPMPRFWRAKVLLQLGRPQDAVRDAEEAVRILPNFPNTHNLLLQIYRRLGKQEDAAREATWLREADARMMRGAGR
jgi:predicted Zn-dependent protease